MNQKTARLLRKAQFAADGDLRYYRRAKRVWTRTPRTARAFWRGMMKSVVANPARR